MPLESFRRDFAVCFYLTAGAYGDIKIVLSLSSVWLAFVKVVIFNPSCVSLRRSLLYPCF